MCRFTQGGEIKQLIHTTVLACRCVVEGGVGRGWAHTCVQVLAHTVDSHQLSGGGWSGAGGCGQVLARMPSPGHDSDD